MSRAKLDLTHSRGVRGGAARPKDVLDNQLIDVDGKDVR